MHNPCQRLGTKPNSIGIDTSGYSKPHDYPYLPLKAYSMEAFARKKKVYSFKNKGSKVRQTLKSPWS